MTGPIEISKCAACGKVNPPGSSFCTSCGKSLLYYQDKASVTCPKCGTPNWVAPDLDKVKCGQCGAPLPKELLPREVGKKGGWWKR
jgi:ribosomal protein S27AE